ncbi:6-aminopenicillanic acid acyl-transferase [Halomonas campisalis]|uniref:6-aminopenicillanic acid acyl-transferase n=1 Tax=Billgrantia campisalis TaxID=74661 RepID=A0ABS9P9K7_9GAMM|nr:C45 family peptidase [Halomonas campisalis]MCG6658435.1 6-aminopenicillanic acid acyl-transferase [Halomonas campisalis]MDR5863106.1 C45 family autoproteolytic acyltransferase/hydrolase [Halomonas campisalis]
MSEHTPLIGWQRASGDPRAIGRALGRAGRRAVHELLLDSPAWARVNDPEHRTALDRMAEATRYHFPRVWAEIEGLAEGLSLPVEPVFAWNCRGDLLANVPDGCTTLIVPGASPLVAHNEDGLPFFAGHCFMFEAAPDKGAGFMAFCYPGSLPGHTLAFTGSGMVQAVNNLRLTGLVPDVPRMVLGRAVLDLVDVEQALALLRRHPHSGGFHFTLADAAGGPIVSVEFGGGEVSVREVVMPWVHANHALHHSRGLAHQIVTDSSRDRQRRGDELIAEGVCDPLTLLHDRHGGGLPILRLDPDDPDQENTLATVVMQPGSDGVAWHVYDRPGAAPVYAGHYPKRASPRDG